MIEFHSFFSLLFVENIGVQLALCRETETENVTKMKEDDK